jgi:hypothetical protein
MGTMMTLLPVEPDFTDALLDGLLRHHQRV